jgi:2-C-methyl-D-erythritol 4-phosphate cytidylyltransferase
MSDVLRYWGVVPAAGTGRRMSAGLPKQYMQLAGQEVIGHTLGRLLTWDFLSGLLVALHADDVHFATLAVADDPRIELVTGGAERCHSVLAALLALEGRAAERDWVLVHDAARPCIGREEVERLRTELAEDPVGGLLAIPVSETVKRADASGRVVQTLNRQGLWLAQTPQMFRFGPLLQAMREALVNDETVTDEAAAIELAGYQPRLVEGKRSNIKITLPADLDTAAAWLAVEGRS